MQDSLLHARGSAEHGSSLSAVALVFHVHSDTYYTLTYPSLKMSSCTDPMVPNTLEVMPLHTERLPAESNFPSQAKRFNKHHRGVVEMHAAFTKFPSPFHHGIHSVALDTQAE